MLIRKPAELRYSDVTPREVYLNRRRFFGAAAGAAGLGLLGRQEALAAGAKLPNVTKSGYTVTGEAVTPYEAVTSYNNYYEFGTGKEEPVKYAQGFQTNPWTLTIEGEVAKKRTFDYDALYKIAPLE